MAPAEALAKADGDDRTRTGNFQLAKLALSQLSYVPEHTADPLDWAWLDSNQRPRPYQGRALTN